jgi:hypothetical protein
VDEYLAAAPELLEDETLAAEEADAEPLHQRDTDRCPVRGAEKGVLLAEEFASGGREVDGEDLSRVGGGKGDPSLALSPVREMGHEDRFSGEDPFPRSQKLAHDTLVRFSSVTHAGLVDDPVSM